MAKDLTPVPCGCGGEAIVETVTTAMEKVPRFRVKCNECDIQTTWEYFAESEAIEAWNLAMSGNVQECAKDARCSERTAKVEKVDTNSPHSQVYKCCKCGQYTHRTAWSRDVVYCPSCGARLEWE